MEDDELARLKTRGNDTYLYTSVSF